MSQVPRYALLPDGSPGVGLLPSSSKPSGTSPGLLGWGDERTWATAAANDALRRHSAHPAAQWMDANYIFVSGVGFVVATACQAADVRIGCGAAFVIYLSAIGLGLMLAQARVRKVCAGLLEWGCRGV